MACSRKKQQESSFVAFQPHANLQTDLPVRHLAVLDMAAHFGDFEPIQVAQRFGSAGDGLGDGVIGGLGGRAHQFDLLVDMIRHSSSPQRG